MMSPVLRSPKWVIGHVLAVAAVAAFVALGFWQLDRLEERRSFNALLIERASAAPVDGQQIASGRPDDLAYRRATLEGTYEPERELLLSTRSHEGRPGHHVLTPLRPRTGPPVVVDRGWVPLEWTTTPVQEAAPPAGTVRVAGLLLPSEPHGRVVQDDSGRITMVTGANLDRLEEQIGAVAPLYLLAQEQEPAPDAFPVYGSPPEVTEGSHLSYAIQWFLFAGVVVVGYPALLRRAVRDARPAAP